jgi:electron transfer flavoprotein alpha subunit
MVLIFAENQKGQFKKTALEAITFGSRVAAQLGSTCAALVLGEAANPAELGKYGAQKVLHATDAAFGTFDSQVFTAAIADAVKQTGASLVVIPASANGKSLLGRLSVRLQAASASGINALPDTAAGFKVRRAVFSGKAVATYELRSEVNVVSLMGNAFPPDMSGQAAPVEAISLQVPASRIRVKSVSTVEGVVPLPEAELVVSAGRGLKGPENWGIIEELAEVLGATTACSRPVADAHWRPHHEHVGQTGIAIRPNLYIAVGISGAIQHLAGVNSSKVIVVINKDPEAPFFKAADYGVVGDAFEVVPQLTAALRSYKAAQ